MSVLIKGMEIPKTCIDCDWSKYVGNGRAMCRRVSKTDKADIMTKRRADFCPLIEVPPHGRLIDADALRVLFADWYRVLDDNMREEVALRYIDDVPTVIEAED